ncbi:hypothetical protein D3C87_1796110 [compost metagenome]
MEIIEKEIGDRCLRRRGFQCGVTGQCAGCRIKTGIRNAPLPHTAIVVRDVFKQPFDGIVSIRGLIDVVVTFFLVNMRRHVRPHALAQVAAAHILVYEYELVAHQRRARAQSRRVFIGTVGSHAVTRALH